MGGLPEKGDAAGEAVAAASVGTTSAPTAPRARRQCDGSTLLDNEADVGLNCLTWMTSIRTDDGYRRQHTHIRLALDQTFPREWRRNVSWMCDVRVSRSARQFI